MQWIHPVRFAGAVYQFAPVRVVLRPSLRALNAATRDAMAGRNWRHPLSYPLEPFSNQSRLAPVV